MMRIIMIVIMKNYYYNDDDAGFEAKPGHRGVQLHRGE